MTAQNEANIAISSIVFLSEKLCKNSDRLNAIQHCRDRLMQSHGITRARAELAAWKAMSDMESRRVPAGHFIDSRNTSSNLLVINTPAKNMVFTLLDLISLQDLTLKDFY